MNIILYSTDWKEGCFSFNFSKQHEFSRQQVFCFTTQILVLFTGSAGIRNLRFKPTYNPYTEPSMEVFAFHKGLKKWVEIGNSGMFRPEMLLPMGLPPDVNVAGYGLSLERLVIFSS